MRWGVWLRGREGAKSPLRATCSIHTIACEYYKNSTQKDRMTTTKKLLTNKQTNYVQYEHNDILTVYAIQGYSTFSYAVVGIII